MPSGERETEGFPGEGVELSHLIVVADLERARDWYRDVLGAEVYREYGGTTAAMSFRGTWLLLVTAGPPTEDKPGVTLVPPADPDRISHGFTIRVPDCRAAYEVLRSRGAEFLTPPNDRGGEVRCFFRDPDGNLMEISSIG